MVEPVDPVYERYLKCAQAIWRMFEKDPLPSDEPAHTMLERLEALIRRGLVGPMPKAVACDTSSPLGWLKRSDVLTLVNLRIAEVMPVIRPDHPTATWAHGLLRGLKELPTFPTRVSHAIIGGVNAPVRSCATCHQPFNSPDSDPRCSSCVEAGDAQGHAPVPRTVVVDERWYDGVLAAMTAVQAVVNSKTKEQTYSRRAAEQCLRAISALPRPDAFRTAKSLLAEVVKFIDGIEQTAIDANRRAGHNARERDNAVACLSRAADLLHGRTPDGNALTERDALLTDIERLKRNV